VDAGEDAAAAGIELAGAVEDLPASGLHAAITQAATKVHNAPTGCFRNAHESPIVSTADLYE
jgi:hypothetical protein